MKRFILFFIVTSFSFSNIQAQDFYDGFDEDNGLWFSISDVQSTEMYDGNLYIKQTRIQKKVTVGVLFQEYIDQTSNFQIESKMTLMKGVVGNGLIWNFKDSENYCKLIITDRDGQFAIYQYVNGNTTTIKKWGDSSSINKNFSANTFKIERNGETTYLFINDNMIYSFDLEYSGNQVGLLLGNGSKLDNTLKVDYFSLTLM